MARLVPYTSLLANDGTQKGSFAAVDDDGAVLAVGELHVELVPGAQRHGSLQFVVPNDPNAVPDTNDGQLLRSIAGGHA